MSFCDKKSLNNCIKAFIRRCVGVTILIQFLTIAEVRTLIEKFVPRSFFCTTFYSFYLNSSTFTKVQIDHYMDIGVDHRIDTNS
jgi:hypothetical protein